MKDSDNMEELEKLYNKTRDELLAKQMSNSETYDRSMLSLSSAFLALSITFIKDIVPVKESLCTWLLYLSWGLFALTIIVVFLSFIYGQKGIKRLLAGAEEYYLKKKGLLSFVWVNFHKSGKKAVNILSLRFP